MGCCTKGDGKVLRSLRGVARTGGRAEAGRSWVLGHTCGRAGALSLPDPAPPGFGLEIRPYYLLRSLTALSSRWFADRLR